MAPLVTGDVNVAALGDLVRLCVELDRLRRAGGAGSPGTPAAPGTPVPDTAAPDTPAPDSTAAWAALEQAVIGKTTILLLHSCSAFDVR
jgi:hypothetical protein